MTGASEAAERAARYVDSADRHALAARDALDTPLGPVAAITAGINVGLAIVDALLAMEARLDLIANVMPGVSGPLETHERVAPPWGGPL